ncbi:unnamed protein product, partial [Mycena citricolor]
STGTQPNWVAYESRNRENQRTGRNLSPLETNDTLSQWLGCFNECIQFAVVFRWDFSGDPYISARHWLP